MTRLIAQNLSYRVVAIACFALGAAWHFWFAQTEPQSESRILVYPAPWPKKLWEVRQITSGYDFGGNINTCGAYFREKACLLESEDARNFILKNWRERRKSYIAIDYPCVDCAAIYDVLIEQNKSGEWQITIWSEQDQALGQPWEVVAVALKRRRATEYDEHKHVVGESILVFEDAEGKEILTL
jgi:hypothetical protein